MLYFNIICAQNKEAVPPLFAGKQPLLLIIVFQKWVYSTTAPLFALETSFA